MNETEIREIERDVFKFCFFGLVYYVGFILGCSENYIGRVFASFLIFRGLRVGVVVRVILYSFGFAGII